MVYQLLSLRLSGGPLLRHLLRLIERISNIPLLTLLVLLSILIPAVLFPMHGIGSIKPLDLHFSYSSDQVYEHFALLGAEGRNAYAAWALTSDLAFPVIYSLAFSVALMLVFRKLFPPASLFRYLSLFPLLTVVIDWCENLSLVWVRYVFPERADAVVHVASSLTSLKWSLLTLTVLLLLMTVSLWAVSRLRYK